MCLCSHLTDKAARWEDPAGRTGSASGDGSQGNGSGSNIPSLLSMATRSHMDITTPPLPQVRTNLEAFSIQLGELGWLHHFSAGQCWSTSCCRAQTQARTNVPPNLPHIDQGKRFHMNNVFIIVARAKMTHINTQPAHKHLKLGLTFWCVSTIWNCDDFFI